ncbi:MAG: Arm DNA-binding domain-containing protein, partial [Rhodomicrobium sp.]
MARIIERLAALKVAKIAKPGFYSDGAGLYLQVTGSAAKSWIYRFRLDGKRHDMGLGPFPL